MTITPTPKNLAIAVLGATVIGLGTVVAIDHTAGASQPTAAAAPAGISPALRSIIGTAATGTNSGQTGTGSGWGQTGTGSGPGQRAAMMQRISQLFGLTPDQLKNEILQGQSLDQIAGGNDQAIKDEINSYVSAAVDRAVTQGAISPGQAASVKQDVSDLLTQLFAADLGKLRPAG